ncbi:hypothetical protein QVD17_40463 [Tagetes erecta]|uniref:Uncharacterized protein n=1 Tax=Tagetes erecta TaxID=13708 RepID=A0AAD8NHW5_TARER|nr:hypothetical protein QVD17_40463 [Tagetes erecta]
MTIQQTSTRHLLDYPVTVIKRITPKCNHTKNIKSDLQKSALTVKWSCLTEQVEKVGGPHPSPYRRFDK